MQVQQQQIQQKTRYYKYNFTSAQMRHYFYKPPLRYIWLLLLGGALCVLGIVSAINAASNSSANFGVNPSPSPFQSFTPYLFISGVVFLIWGAIPFLQYADRPTNSDYAHWVTERSKPLYNTALQRLHIDESQCENIIEVLGGISSLLQLTKKIPEKEILVKRLPDGTRHYSINVSTYIFLTKDDLAIYSGYINALTQVERFEDADHYYYHDIVGISTSGPVYVYLDRPYGEEEQRQGLLVRMNNGDVVGTDYAESVILRSGENRVKIEGVDKVVAALLSLLRDHKVTLAEANKISRDTI